MSQGNAKMRKLSCCMKFNGSSICEEDSPKKYWKISGFWRRKLICQTERLFIHSVKRHGSTIRNVVRKGSDRWNYWKHEQEFVLRHASSIDVTAHLIRSLRLVVTLSSSSTKIQSVAPPLNRLNWTDSPGTWALHIHTSGLRFVVVTLATCSTQQRRRISDAFQSNDTCIWQINRNVQWLVRRPHVSLSVRFSLFMETNSLKAKQRALSLKHRLLRVSLAKMLNVLRVSRRP